VVNDTTSIRVPTTSRPRLESPALFALDADGVIKSANVAAETFWTCAPNAMIGLPFNALITLYPVSGVITPRSQQWEVLCASALNQSIACSARLPDQPPIEVSVRLEEARGESIRYFAFIEDPTHRRETSPPMLVDSGLALLADQGAVGFFDLNFKAGQVYYSPAWKRVLGYNDNELANTYDSWLRLIHPDDSAAAPDYDGRRKVCGVRGFGVEIRMLHRRGHYVWVHCLGTQVYSSRGDLERVTGLQIDISERKELEENSLVNEERLHRLCEQGELALFDLNFATDDYWFSAGWQHLIGAPILTGTDALHTFVDALPSDLASQGAQPFFLRPVADQPSFVTALRLKRPDGTGETTLFGAHRQVSRKGELLRAVGFCCKLPSSITELASTPFPASMVDPVLACFSEALIVTDVRGCVSYLNTRAERLLDITCDEARRLKLGEVFRLVYRSDGSPAETALDEALASDDDTRMYANHALLPAGRPGTPHEIVWSARRIASTDGSPNGMAIVFRDPDEMSLSPEELLKINRFETLGVVAGGISHDFNNLLTTILGGISQAKDNNDPSFLPDSERACMAAKALTKQLLSFAKGGKAEAVQTLTLIDLIRDAARLARAGANADVRIDVPDTISPVCVDRAQILQVFQNLIINAVQALPARGGTVWLSAANVELTEALPGLVMNAGPYVRVQVRDNGSGIAPENLEKIFEPFFTTKKHGTGLGLPMVRGIVRRYGGDVSVISTVGFGTAFDVYLPQARAGAVQDQPTRRAPSLRFGTGTRRILLMDDDPDICRLTEGMLASLDYQCDVARNGEEALNLYRRLVHLGRSYDAVILDLTVVGGSGGEETFHHLKTMDKDVRAIVCSGYDSDEMVERFMAMGFAGYLTKPFRAADLGKVLKSVLGG